MPVIGLFVLALVFLLAILLMVLGAVWLWRVGRWGGIVLAALVALAWWGIAAAIEPDLSYYREVFERESGRTFPASGRFVDRQATFPEDAAWAVLEIDSVDAARLGAAVELDRQHSMRTQWSCGGGLPKAGYQGVRTDHKDGRCFWWGVSEAGDRLAFEYVDL